MRLPTTVNPTKCWSPLNRESILAVYVLLCECITPSAFIPSLYSCERIMPYRTPRPAIGAVNLFWHIILDRFGT
jgi:hypothetical protein